MTIVPAPALKIAPAVAGAAAGHRTIVKGQGSLPQLFPAAGAEGGRQGAVFLAEGDLGGGKGEAAAAGWAG
ncbi:MAG: hypothetical protein HFE94_04845 [Acutalibacter sp.]|nr:hypothetical protein [Acutalibacter sp.]